MALRLEYYSWKKYKRFVSVMITKILPGDDQDLDDRVIRQLWEDNKELREEVGRLSSIKN